MEKGKIGGDTLEGEIGTESCILWVCVSDRKVLQRFFGFLLFCAESDEGNKKKRIGKNPNQTEFFQSQTQTDFFFGGNSDQYLNLLLFIYLKRNIIKSIFLKKKRHTLKNIP